MALLLVLHPTTGSVCYLHLRCLLIIMHMVIFAQQVDLLMVVILVVAIIPFAIAIIIILIQFIEPIELVLIVIVIVLAVVIVLNLATIAITIIAVMRYLFCLNRLTLLDFNYIPSRRFLDYFSF